MASSKRAQKKARPRNGARKPATRKPAARKSAARAPKAAALQAARDHVRGSAAAPTSPFAAQAASYAALPVNTVLATAETMVRCSRPFAEFPLRAARARTPSEMWSVNARFVQDVVSESLLATKRFWSSLAA